jgi:DNA-binding PadR family transcriptional regulator
MNRRRIWSKSKARESILLRFLEGGPRWQYSYDVIKRSRVRSGLFYRIVWPLEADGLLEAQWDDQEPNVKYRRRMYRLTVDGRNEATWALMRSMEGSRADG